MSVKIPRSQTHDPNDRGTPLTIGHVMLAYMAPVKWYDKSGSPHEEIVFVVGDTVYRDPAGEQWASRLQQFKETFSGEIVSRCHDNLHEEIRKVVREELGAGAEVAGHDEVDVLADQTDQDVTTSTK